MSDEGRAYVKAHSPFTGTTWWFHYVMGDLANAQHDYRIFISDKRLAKEWPLTRSTCSRARAELIAGGYLVPLSETTAPGKPREYRFAFVDAEHMAVAVDAPRGEARREQDAPRGEARTRSTTKRVRASNPDPVLLPTEVEPKGVTEPRREPRATDDPVKRTAHRLAVLAYEQRPAPVTRGGFDSVMARIEAELRAGTTVPAIKKAIEAGDVTWTADGFRTAISRANPKARRRAPVVGDGRSLPELLDEALRAEEQEQREQRRSSA